MKALLNRIKEPSTWAGLAMLAPILGAPVDKVDAVNKVVTALFAAAAVFLPEKTAK